MAMVGVSRKAMAAYLDWWRDAGLTAGVSDRATDWFALDQIEMQAPLPVAPSRAQPRPSEPEPSRPAPAATSLRPAGTINPAHRALAASAGSLDQLHRLLRDFDGCGLKTTATHMCFYRGAAEAPTLLIGEAPGRDEDLAGKPFVGRAGQLLDLMLASIGLDETSVHIANTVYWRPPGNRTPTPEETLICAPFLARQIELVKPKRIVLLGGVAAKTILGLDEGITKLRGKWRTLAVAGNAIPVLATWHPAYLLRTPAAKRQAWQDLLMLQDAL